MESRTHWQRVYETKTEDEVSWFQDTPAVSADLISSVAPSGATVIDVGGGASRLVDRLVADGYQVTVLDIADAALAKARTRLGAAAHSVDWVAADITQWQPVHRFKVWHDRALFHFLVKPEDRRAYLRLASTAIEDGGFAIIGTFASDGPQRCSGLPVRRYDPEDLAAEFGPAFEHVNDLRHDHATPSGSVQRFQFTVLRKLP
ncbi:class I SAM-dependent methyltransferase [Caenispirillum salinarum]|uniref:class I SAM-dependent methyltransferase n=1 Tax=Caenispirillum salinarum TaxID=859058 RepID=UPI0038500340